MGEATLVLRSDGQTITADWINAIRAALSVNLVPRNSSGVPSDQGGSLGTQDYGWKELHVDEIFLGGNSLDESLISGRPHRIRSGKAKTSGYPNFLTPAGSGGGLSATLEGSATNLVTVINASSVTLAANLLYSSLAAAPSTNNTCLVNDSALSGQSWTKILGEHGGGSIAIDTVGSEITALDGQIAAFKGASEVFLARVDTTGGKLWPIYRGWAGTAREALSDNATLTLLKVNTVLMKNDAVTKVATTYFPESVGVAPAAGTAGKVYLERSTGKHAYDDGTDISYDYLIVGWLICDSADCQWAQPYHFDAAWKGDIDVRLKVASTTEVRIEEGSYASVYGIDYAFVAPASATQAGNMDSGEAIAASTTFFVYLKKDGGLVFSTVTPRPLSWAVKGFYHPSEYYRCIGAVETDGSSNFIYDLATVGTSKLESDVLLATGASDKTVALPNAKLHKDRSVFIKKTDSGAGKIAVSAVSGETMDGDSTLNLLSQYDFLHVVSDGANWFVKDYLCSAATTITSLSNFTVNSGSLVIATKRRPGRVVDIHVENEITGTYTSSAVETITTIPADFIPEGTKRIAWIVNSAGPDILQVNDDGTIGIGTVDTFFAGPGNEIRACGGAYALDGTGGAG